MPFAAGPPPARRAVLPAAQRWEPTGGSRLAGVGCCLASVTPALCSPRRSRSGADGDEAKQEVAYDLLIGADGARSEVRAPASGPPGTPPPATHRARPCAAPPRAPRAWAPSKRTRPAPPPPQTAAQVRAQMARALPGMSVSRLSSPVAAMEYKAFHDLPGGHAPMDPLLPEVGRCAGGGRLRYSSKPARALLGSALTVGVCSWGGGVGEAGRGRPTTCPAAARRWPPTCRRPAGGRRRR